MSVINVGDLGFVHAGSENECTVVEQLTGVGLVQLHVEQPRVSLTLA